MLSPVCSSHRVGHQDLSRVLMTTGSDNIISLTIRFIAERLAVPYVFRLPHQLLHLTALRAGSIPPLGYSG